MATSDIESEDHLPLVCDVEYLTAEYEVCLRLSVPIEENPRDYSSVAQLWYTRGADLWETYLRTNTSTDLDDAIELFEKSVDQTPSDHPHYARFLENLGRAYSARYERKGDIADIDAAIECCRLSLDETPVGHRDRAGRLSSLAAGYGQRYQVTGNTTDLDAAIQLYEASIDQTTLDDPARAGRLRALGTGHGERYERTSNVTDLDRAMELYQASVDQTPVDHPVRAGRLGNLGGGYIDRYESTGDIANLDAAIKWCQASVDQTPLDHPDRLTRLETLAVAYHSRYERTGNTNDQDMALEWCQVCVDQTPVDHWRRAESLRNLGAGCYERYQKRGNITDLDTSIQMFEEATFVMTSRVSHRLEATIELLPIYAKLNRWEEACAVAHRASQLVPLLTPRYLQHADKQHLLAKVAGLASDSAAVALNAGKNAFTAIQLLELGRSVISGSLTDMRTDITELLSSYPKLGQEFVRLRDLLDSPRLSRTIDPLSSLNDQSPSPYDVHYMLEKLLSKIRTERGFENFLLPLRREDIQNAAERGAIVVINVSQYRCDAIIVQKHVIRSIPLARLSSKDIEGRARERNLGSADTLRWMWDTIANPILETLSLTSPPSGSKWSRIWWIPTRLLTKFPLHAAGHHQEQPTETVLDRVMSSYSSSIKAMSHLCTSHYRDTSPSASGEALLVAVPDGPGSRSLPYATKEVAIIRDVCKSMALKVVEPGRRRSDILSSLPRCKIFHFAGHVFTHADDPSRSYLLLNDGRSDSLEVGSLLEMSVRDNLPFLAYLSACGTGQIKGEKLLDESIHLVSAFQLAGFRHVIGTLWEVRDEVCVDVARITYEGMRDGFMTDESVCLGLHNASKKLRDAWLSARGSKHSQKRRSRVRNASHDDYEQVELIRDVTVYEDDEADEGSLSWVPYVHYGV